TLRKKNSRRQFEDLRQRARSLHYFNMPVARSEGRVAFSLRRRGRFHIFGGRKPPGRLTSDCHLAGGGATMKKALLGVVVFGLALAADEKKPDDVKDKLKGTWTIVALEADGKKLSEDLVKGQTMTFDADKVTHEEKGKKEPATFKIDPSQKPGHLDMTPTEGPDKDKTVKMIFQLDGDTLKIAASTKEGGERPKSFDDKGIMIITLKREKK